MESIKSQKWRVRLSIVAIFLLGCVAGGLAVNLYHQGRPESGGKVPPFMRRGGGGLEGMLKGLNLNDQQQQEVDRILADTRQKLMEIRRGSEPQYTEIRKQTRERLKEVLTEDQWNQFQKLIKERQDHPDRQHRRPPPDGEQTPRQ